MGHNVQSAVSLTFQSIYRCPNNKILFMFFEQNDSIYESLNTIPWYSMRLSEQKALAYSLLRMQNGTGLKIGPINQWELNFEMASTVSIQISHNIIFTSDQLYSYNGFCFSSHNSFINI